MGQKVHPASFRLGHKLINTWSFFCYAGDKSLRHWITKNLHIRKYINDNCSQAGISKINTQLSNVKITIDVLCKKPRLIIGSNGAGIEKIKSAIAKIIDDNKLQIIINVSEVKNYNVDATLIAKSIAHQLEKRVSFRKVMKKAVQLAMKSGAKGIKVTCAGRLAGADIARTEKYMEGTVPLHTLRSKIEFALEEAKTLYGIIGVKVWVHTEDRLSSGNVYEKKEARARQDTSEYSNVRNSMGGATAKIKQGEVTQKTMINLK